MSLNVLCTTIYPILIRVVVTIGCWHVMESEYSSVLSSFSQRGWYSALIVCSEFSEISMTPCMTEDWERAATQWVNCLPIRIC
jgi:hypothetical protein